MKSFAHFYTPQTGGFTVHFLKYFYTYFDKTHALLLKESWMRCQVWADLNLNILIEIAFLVSLCPGTFLLLLHLF